MLSTRDRSGEKPYTEVRNIEFISKQPSQFFVFTFLSLQFKFSVHPCILCCLIAFPPHPFAYFLTSWRFDCQPLFGKMSPHSYRTRKTAEIEPILLVICFKLPITRTPENSNFFRFPLKVRVIGSQL